MVESVGVNEVRAGFMSDVTGVTSFDDRDFAAWSTYGITQDE